MTRIQPLLPFLRPLVAPRRTACQQLFRFSTASRLRAEEPSQPSPKAPSTPQEASRAADLAAAEAATDADSAQSPAPKPTLPSKRLKSSRSGRSKPTGAPIEAQRSTLELPPPKYHVARSSNKNLPIYTDYKRGGNLHLTTIRKITGDLSALRDELRVFLNKKNEDVKINSLTQHVVVKGHHVPQITDFLKARGM